jgi:hypothetical protein
MTDYLYKKSAASNIARDLEKIWVTNVGETRTCFTTVFYAFWEHQL